MRAFSLVELSIVLVILGLLTGGVLTGQSLIRAAELRAVTAEFDRYHSAIHIFRNRYMAYPGDMQNAVQFWNRQVNASWCFPVSGATVTLPGTCNGNDDGRLNDAGGASQSAEKFQFWRQLALAGLIEGDYTGITGTGGASHAVRGTNVPQSRVGNAGWEIAWIGETAGGTNFFAGIYNNRLQIGAERLNSGLWDAFLSPEEAWSIDMKSDDGKPGRGRVLVGFREACTNSTGPADLDADYHFTSTGRICSLYFINLF